MNIKDAEGLPLREPESLKAHVLAFVTTYNFAKHLKALQGALPHPTARRRRRNPFLPASRR